MDTPFDIDRGSIYVATRYVRAQMLTCAGPCSHKRAKHYNATRGPAKVNIKIRPRMKSGPIRMS
jgi:hypothetical protein